MNNEPANRFAEEQPEYVQAYTERDAPGRTAICTCSHCSKMLYEGDELAQRPVYKMGELDEILLYHAACFPLAYRFEFVREDDGGQITLNGEPYGSFVGADDGGGISIWLRGGVAQDSVFYTPGAALAFLLERLQAMRHPNNGFLRP